ncbi:hypothetical protein Lser_V15G18715 [Lactuca serriola]
MFAQRIRDDINGGDGIAANAPKKRRYFFPRKGVTAKTLMLPLISVAVNGHRKYIPLPTLFSVICFFHLLSTTHIEEKSPATLGSITGDDKSAITGDGSLITGNRLYMGFSWEIDVMGLGHGGDAAGDPPSPVGFGRRQHEQDAELPKKRRGVAKNIKVDTGKQGEACRIRFRRGDHIFPCQEPW